MYPHCLDEMGIMPYSEDIFIKGATMVAVYRLPTQKQMEDTECPPEILSLMSYEEWIKTICKSGGRIPLLPSDQVDNDAVEDAETTITAEENMKKRHCEVSPSANDSEKHPAKKPRVEKNANT
jgi:hypothetical protein